MASFAVVLLTVSLLMATSSAAPKNHRITIPEECTGNGFCTVRPKGYDEIEKMIDRLLPPYLINIDSRSGTQIPYQSDDEDNCPSEMTTLTVYTHKKPNRTKVDIIVQTKLFPQSLTKVICKHSDSQTRNLKAGDPQCFKKLGLNNFNMELTCRETMATRSLLVFDPDVNNFRVENFTIPVCCSCHIKDKY